MTVHSLYPGFIKLYYEVSGHAHVQTLPVKPAFNSGTSQWDVEEYNPSGQMTYWHTALDAYVLVLKAKLNSTNGDIQFADLWTMSSAEADPLWVASYDINVAGTNATAALAFGQTTYTYRTALGGIFRHVIMEPSETAANLKQSGSDLTGVDDTLRDFMVGGDNFIWGRDGGMLVTCIQKLSKTNDALRKKYLLDV